MVIGRLIKFISKSKKSSFCVLDSPFIYPALTHRLLELGKEQEASRVPGMTKVPLNRNPRKRPPATVFFIATSLSQPGFCAPYGHFQMEEHPSSQMLNPFVYKGALPIHLQSVHWGAQVTLVWGLGAPQTGGGYRFLQR